MTRLVASEPWPWHQERQPPTPVLPRRGLGRWSVRDAGWRAPLSRRAPVSLTCALLTTLPSALLARGNQLRGRIRPLSSAIARAWLRRQGRYRGCHRQLPRFRRLATTTG